jgi:excinuclease ABC subunit A
VFDEIRKVFAATRDARARGYRAGRFSFNIKGGRCEECQGQGQRRIEMNFLPDLYVPCQVCEGKRFNRQTLEIRYRGRSIADVLDLRVDEAAEFFQNFPAIARLLGSLQEVGLGYITLGQSSITLSGGEAQRIKLAAELGRTDTGKSFYILDEPTTGLHFDDIKKLLLVLGRLVDLGNTVVVIEHHLDVIKSADWIIDLGPEGGNGGGWVVATGTPEQVAALADNATGQFLRGVLGDEVTGDR